MRHVWRVMKIEAATTDTAVLIELGRRLSQRRLAFNLTQAQLAEQAGVAKRTVQRLETGGVSPQLSGMIRICRVLDLIERFDLLVPESLPSPVEQLKREGQRRQRASKTGIGKTVGAKSALPAPVPRHARVGIGKMGAKWTWKDEA